MKKPKLSLIIPIYNSELYLSECLLSVKQQTFKDFEVILIDDGSVDSSFEICKKYCLEDSRFKVVWQKNSGIAAARNRGLEMCCGEYIGFIDSDDYLISDALEKIKNEIDKNKRTQCLFWNYIEFRDNRLLKICDIELEDCVDNPLYFEFIPHLPYAYKRKNNILYRKGGFYSAVWRVCIKRDIVVNYDLSFNVQLLRGEDREFIKNVVRICEHISYFDEYLYVYRIHSNSTMHTQKDKLEPEKLDTVINIIERYRSNYIPHVELYNKLSKKLKKSAVLAYKYQAINMTLGMAGKNNVCKNLDSLFKNKTFRKWFSWRYIFSQGRGKEKIVLILYKLRLYKLLEKYRKGN